MFKWNLIFYPLKYTSSSCFLKTSRRPVTQHFLPILFLLFHFTVICGEGKIVCPCYLHFLFHVWFQFLERLNSVYHGKVINVEVSDTFTFLHGCWNVLILQLPVQFQTIWIQLQNTINWRKIHGDVVLWKWTRHQKTHFSCTLWLSSLLCWCEYPVSVCQLAILYTFLLLSLSSYQFKSKSYLVILLKYTLSSSRSWFNFSTDQWFHHVDDCSCDISLDDLCLMSFGKLQG